jgi:hypothetical protein
VKTLLHFLLILLLIACSERAKEQAPPTAIAQGAKTEFIFLINPGDCVSCLRSFDILFERVKSSTIDSASISIVLPEKRQAEREKIISELLPKAPGCKVIWSTDSFNNFYSGLQNPSRQSYLVIKKGGKVTWAKPLKDITGATEIEQYLPG